MAEGGQGLFELDPGEDLAQAAVYTEPEHQVAARMIAAANVETVGFGV